MLWLLICVLFHSTENVAAPPVPLKCLVKLPIYKGTQTACDNEQQRKLSDLASPTAAEEFDDVEKFGADNMADLLLIRALGIYDYEKHNLNNLRICPKHLKELGKDWKKQERILHHSKCTIPSLHGLSPDHQTRVPGDRSLLKSEALTVWQQFQTLISPGSGICSHHQKSLRTLQTESAVKTADKAVATDDEQAPLGRSIGGHDLRHRCPQSLFESPPQSLTFRGIQKQKVCGSGSSYEPQSSPDSQQTLGTSSANCELVKTGIQTIATAVGIHKRNINFPRSFVDLEPATKRRRVGTAVHITDAVMSAMAPDAPNELRERVMQKHTGDAWYKKRSEKFIGMVRQIVDEYISAETRRSRMELLSHIAPWFKWAELEKFIPGLTPYAWKEARRYAKLSKAGLIQPPSKRLIQRYDPKMVLNFIEFITSPQIASDMPFGFATVKLSTGIKKEIPNLLRASVNTRIIRQYRMYMTQRGFREDQLLSDSTMLRILHACKATTRKSMKGIDYLTYEGTEGISSLLSLVAGIKEMTGDADWAKDISRVFKETKIFLKTDYKALISDHSRFADYCSWYALSDPTDVSLRVQDHGDEQLHRFRCGQCNALMEAFSSLESTIADVAWPSAHEKTRAEFTFEQARTGILNWQKHIIRTVHQDKAREEIVNGLNEESVHLLLDWAMKFIPEKGREPSSEWYGKRGLSWHITVVLANITGMINMRTFVHVFDQTKQDNEAVVAILLDTLKRIKEEIPDVTTAYIRSDNAVCYHGALTLTSVPKISEESRITIKRWDFSETQSGKGAADRAANIIKRHVKLYCAEDNAATTAAQFIEAASSHGGVKQTTFIHTTLPPPTGTRSKPSIPGISKYNNYEFTGQEMRVWRAYKIGIGKVVTYKAATFLPSLPVVHMQMTLGQRHQQLGAREAWIQLRKDILPAEERQPAPEGTWTDSFVPDEPDDFQEEPECIQGSAASLGECTETDDMQMLEGRYRQRLFPCDEEGCTKVYQSYWNLFRHQTIGKHTKRAERQNLRDFSIENYIQQIEVSQIFSGAPAILSALRSQQDEESTEDSTYPLAMGWALKERKQAKRFTQSQKDFLVEKFDEGIQDSNKYDPRDAAKMMQADPRFPNKDMWLTAGQVQGFWSRLALNRERALATSQAPAADDDTDPDDDDNIGSDDLAERIFEEEVSDIIQSNRDQIFGDTSDSGYESHIERVIETRSMARRRQAGGSSSSR